MASIYDSLALRGAQVPVASGILDNPTHFSSAKFSEDHASNRTLARLFIPMTPDQAQQYKQTVRSNVKSHDLSDILDSLVVTVENNAVIGGGYLYFLLSQASEPLQESVNIVKTSGDQYVTYTYGSQPPVFSYAGILPNTLQDDWRLAFLLMYMFLTRASALAKYQKSVVLAYDNLLITGSFLSQQQTFNAETQRYAQFNFNLLVKKITILNREPLTPAGDNASFGGAGVFGGLGAKDLLGLASSVSGTDVSPSKSLITATDSPRRSRGDEPPNFEEIAENVREGLINAQGIFYQRRLEDRTTVGYRIGEVFPETIREPDLDAPFEE